MPRNRCGGYVAHFAQMNKAAGLLNVDQRQGCECPGGNLLQRFDSALCQSLKGACMPKHALSGTVVAFWHLSLARENTRHDFAKARNRRLGIGRNQPRQNLAATLDRFAQFSLELRRGRPF